MATFMILNVLPKSTLSCIFYVISSVSVSSNIFYTNYSTYLIVSTSVFLSRVSFMKILFLINLASDQVDTRLFLVKLSFIFLGYIFKFLYAKRGKYILILFSFIFHCLHFFLLFVIPAYVIAL